MQLIRKLPTLHNKAFESYITSIKDSVDRVKNLSMSFSQFSSYVAFLNDKVLKNELEFRKNSYKNDMELVEVQNDNFESIKLLEGKVSHLERKDNSNSHLIGNLRQEIDLLDITNQSVYEAMSTDLKELTQIQGDKSLRDKEEIKVLAWINSHNRDSAAFQQLRDGLQAFMKQFREEILTKDKIKMDAVIKIRQMLEGNEDSTQKVHNMWKKHNELSTEELHVSRNILRTVRETILKDKKPFTLLLEDLKEFSYNHQETFGYILDELQAKIKRYSSMIEVNQEGNMNSMKTTKKNN